MTGNNRTTNLPGRKDLQGDGVPVVWGGRNILFLMVCEETVRVANRKREDLLAREWKPVKKIPALGEK